MTEQVAQNERPRLEEIPLEDLLQMLDALQPLEPAVRITNWPPAPIWGFIVLTAIAALAVAWILNVRKRKTAALERLQRRLGHISLASDSIRGNASLVIQELRRIAQSVYLTHPENDGREPPAADDISWLEWYSTDSMQMLLSDEAWKDKAPDPKHLRVCCSTINERVTEIMANVPWSLR